MLRRKRYINETVRFSSTVTGETCKTNHIFDCMEKCISLLATNVESNWSTLVKQLTLFAIGGIITDRTMREKCLYSELFWSAISRIWTKYREILRISPYSVRMRENKDQNNSKCGHFLYFMLCFTSKFLLKVTNRNIRKRCEIYVQS